MALGAVHFMARREEGVWFQLSNIFPSLHIKKDIQCTLFRCCCESDYTWSHASCWTLRDSVHTLAVFSLMCVCDCVCEMQFVWWSTSSDCTEWQAHCRHSVWSNALDSIDCIWSAVCLGQQRVPTIISNIRSSIPQVVGSTADIRLHWLRSSCMRLWQLYSPAALFFRFTIIILLNWITVYSVKMQIMSPLYSSSSSLVTRCYMQSLVLICETARPNNYVLVLYNFATLIYDILTSYLLCTLVFRSYACGWLLSSTVLVNTLTDANHRHYIPRGMQCFLFVSPILAGHSVETAMLCVHNDIVCAVDEKPIVALLLLDLSAAFYTVDHSTLLTVLQWRFGLCNTVLTWLQSYLSDRTQKFLVDSVMSQPINANCSVPQGSVFGPVEFIT